MDYTCRFGYCLHSSRVLSTEQGSRTSGVMFFAVPTLPTHLPSLPLHELVTLPAKNPDDVLLRLVCVLWCVLRGIEGPTHRCLLLEGGVLILDFVWGR